MTAITHCLAAPGSQEWLDARQQGIGGSDIATNITVARVRADRHQQEGENK